MRILIAFTESANLIGLDILFCMWICNYAFHSWFLPADLNLLSSMKLYANAQIRTKKFRFLSKILWRTWDQFKNITPTRSDIFRLVSRLWWRRCEFDGLNLLTWCRNIRLHDDLSSSSCRDEGGWLRFTNSAQKGLFYTWNWHKDKLSDLQILPTFSYQSQLKVRRTSCPREFLFEQSVWTEQNRDYCPMLFMREHHAKCGRQYRSEKYIGLIYCTYDRSLKQTTIN